MDGLILCLLGFFCWTFIEYAVHAWMCHIYQTFASSLHTVHHRDPHAVFAVGAWPLIALSWLAAFYTWGWSVGVQFFSGVVVGFASYEALHYRLHFARSLTAFEEHQRRRHLVHHYVNPSLCLGVTSGLWDRVFGTEPSPEQLAEFSAATRGVVPLEGKSNLWLLGRVMARGWRRAAG
jgi:sterol desaturase/sphingolipid hydroxylase (fatty acid hydroxylase superfamily)